MSPSGKSKYTKRFFLGIWTIDQYFGTRGCSGGECLYLSAESRQPPGHVDPSELLWGRSWTDLQPFQGEHFKVCSQWFLKSRKYLRCKNSKFSCKGFCFKQRTEDTRALPSSRDIHGVPLLDTHRKNSVEPVKDTSSNRANLTGQQSCCTAGTVCDVPVLTHSIIIIQQTCVSRDLPSLVHSWVGHWQQTQNSDRVNGSTVKRRGPRCWTD